MTTNKELIYLSGPMTGYKNFNYPKFVRVARELRAKGHRVLNPATQIRPIMADGRVMTIKGLHKWSDEQMKNAKTEEEKKAINFEVWASFLRGDVVAVAKKCTAIYLLKNWRNSRGARFERSIAKRLKFKEYNEGDL